MAKKPDLSGFSAKRKSGSGNYDVEAMLAAGHVEEVDLSLVDRDENQPRPLAEVMDGINDFADELERDNFVLAQYPVYHKEKNGRYTIVVGERRTTAFKIKGRKKITAVIKEFTPKERENIFILQYVENDGKLKKQLSPYSDALWWRHYIDAFHNGVISDAAKARGRTNADISNRLALLDAPEFIKDFVAAANIKDPAIFAGLVRLAKRSGDALAKQLISDFNNGEIKGSFRKHIEGITKAIRSADEQPAASLSTNAEQRAKPEKVEAQKTSTKNPAAKTGTKKTAAVATEDSPGRAAIRKAATLLERAEFTANMIASKPELYGDLMEDLKEAGELITLSLATYSAERAKVLAESATE